MAAETEGKFSIRRSEAQGQGVFADADIPAGSEIGPALRQMDGTGDPNRDYSRTPLARFVNHSSNPNAAFASGDGFVIKALRDIRSGEEILVDYNDSPDAIGFEYRGSEEAPLSCRAAEVTSKPSTWNKTDPLWFLPKQDEPPKGHIEFGSQRHGRPMMLQGVPPHFPLFDSEEQAINDICFFSGQHGRKIPNFVTHADSPMTKGISGVFRRPYILLKDPEGISAKKYLLLLRREVERLKAVFSQKVKSSGGHSLKARTYRENLRNISAAEEQLKIMLSRFGRMSEPKGDRKYRYATSQESHFPALRAQEGDAQIFRFLANQLPGFNLGHFPSSENIAVMPLMIFDERGRSIKVGRILSRIKKKLSSLRLPRLLSRRHDSTNRKLVGDAIDRLIKLNAVSSKKKIHWTLVVSADPSDILTMSTGRKWTSCMTCAFSGSYGSRFSDLDSAISTRDMVAYAVDDENDNWLARVWLRNDGKEKWWPEPKVYGAIDHYAFLGAVKRWLKDRGILGKTGDYNPEARGWSDFLMASIDNQKKRNEREDKLRETEDSRSQFVEWEEQGVVPKTMQSGGDRRLYRIRPRDGISARDLGLLLGKVVRDPSAVKCINDPGFSMRHFVYELPSGHGEEIAAMSEIMWVKEMPFGAGNFVVSWGKAGGEKEQGEASKRAWGLYAQIKNSGIAYLEDWSKDGMQVVLAPKSLAGVFKTVPGVEVEEVEKKQKADDRPLSLRAPQWKGYDMFWFLPNHEKPPKGHIEYLSQKHGLRPTHAKEQHVPLTDEEAKLLQKEIYKLFPETKGAVRPEWDGQKFLPLLIRVKSKKNPYVLEHMPVSKVLGAVKSRLRMERGSAIASKPEDLAGYRKKKKTIRDAARKEGLAESVLRRMRKMSEPSSVSYRYDTEKMISDAKIEVDGETAKVVNRAANAIFGTPKVAEFMRGSWRVPTKFVDAGGRKVRLGKLLSRAMRKADQLGLDVGVLRRLYHANQVAPKASEWTLVVSADPSDILTMSTGRGWTSCVTEGGGSFRDLESAVSAWDMVAYAVDKDNDNWLARVWLRNDGKGGWWPEARAYLTGKLSAEDMRAAATEWLGKRGILGEEGTYHPMARGWSDLLEGTIDGSVVREDVERMREHAVESQHAGWYEEDAPYVRGRGVPGEARKGFYRVRFRYDSSKRTHNAIKVKVDALTGGQSEDFMKHESGMNDSMLLRFPDMYVGEVSRLPEVLGIFPDRLPEMGSYAVMLKPEVDEADREDHRITDDSVQDFISGYIRVNDIRYDIIRSGFTRSLWNVMNALDDARAMYFLDYFHNSGLSKIEIETSKRGLSIIQSLPDVESAVPSDQAGMLADDKPLSLRAPQWEKTHPQDPLWFMPKPVDKQPPGYRLPGGASARSWATEWRSDELEDKFKKWNIPLSGMERSVVGQLCEKVLGKDLTGETPFSHYLPLSWKGKPVLEVLRRIGREDMPDQHRSALSDVMLRAEHAMPGGKMYRYDMSEQSSVPVMAVTRHDAEMLSALASYMKWDKPFQKKSDVFGREDEYIVPMRVRDPYGREVKFGKFLKAAGRYAKKIGNAEDILFWLEDIRKRYSEAPKQEKWELVVSAEPGLIKTMSTGRSWGGKSCVSEGGEKYCSLDSAVSTRDMVAYAVAPGGDKWLSRLWLRSDGKGKWWPEDTVYSTGSSITDRDFMNAVEKWLGDRGILGKRGEYHPEAYGWSDTLFQPIETKRSMERAEEMGDQVVTHDPYEEWYEFEGSGTKQPAPVLSKHSPKVSKWLVEPNPAALPSGDRLPAVTEEKWRNPNREFDDRDWRYNDELKRAVMLGNMLDHKFAHLPEWDLEPWQSIWIDKELVPMGKKVLLSVETSERLAGIMREFPEIRSVRPAAMPAADGGPLRMAPRRARYVHLVAGPRGSGKSTLLRMLKEREPELVVQDIDDAADLMSESLSGGDLESMKQRLVDSVIGSLGGRSAVLAGCPRGLDIPSGRRHVIDVGPAECAGRRRRRDGVGGEAGLLREIEEAREEADDLKEKGFEPGSPEEIAERILSDIKIPDFTIIMPAE